jgi:hypothetical protein
LLVRYDQISNFAERGGLMFRQHGSPESAAGLLEKAAKILESKNPEEALGLYEKAAETIMVEDRPKQAADYLTKVARLQVRGFILHRNTMSLRSFLKRPKPIHWRRLPRRWRTPSNYFKRPAAQTWLADGSAPWSCVT